MKAMYWHEIQTLHLQGEQNTDYITWAMDALCSNEQLTQDYPTGNTVIGLGCIMDGADMPNYTDVAGQTLHSVVAKSQLNPAAVEFYMRFMVWGVEYLFVHMAGDVFAVLSGSQVVEAKWV